MSNPIKGETSFTVEGKTYILKYSQDTLVRLEEKLDMGILKIAGKMESWAKNPVEEFRLGFLRTLFWFGLKEHHPEIEEVAAGELLPHCDDLGTKIYKAFEVAMPRAETKDARPPNRAARRKAAAGTGKTS